MADNDQQRVKRVYRKTADTQKVIFDKAMVIMAEKGFQGTTVREICAQAKIPIGTFYNCFKSKNDILKIIYDKGDAFIGQIEDEIRGKDSCTKLHIFARRYAQLNIDTGIDVMRVLFYPMNEWFAKARPMQDHMLEIVEEGIANKEIRSDIDAKAIVGYLFDVFRGVCYNWCVRNGDFDIEERIDMHVTLMWSFLKA